MDIDLNINFNNYIYLKNGIVQVESTFEKDYPEINEDILLCCVIDNIVEEEEDYEIKEIINWYQVIQDYIETVEQKKDSKNYNIINGLDKKE